MNKREQLKTLIDDLTELYADEESQIELVGDSIISSTCSACRDYGDQLFRSITIVSQKESPCRECDGKGFVAIGEGIRGIRKCEFCSKAGDAL